MVYALGDVPRSQFILWRYFLLLTFLHKGLELTSILQRLGFIDRLDKSFTTSPLCKERNSKVTVAILVSGHVILPCGFVTDSFAKQHLNKGCISLAAARIQSWRPNVLWRAQHLCDLGLLTGGEWQRKKESIRLIVWLLDWLIDGFDAMWLTNPKS